MSAFAARIAGLAARTLPVGMRERYREEWAADVAAAPEAGILPSRIALGAVVFSLTLDRDDPGIAGIPRAALSQRHARWALLLVAATGTVALMRGAFENVGIGWLPITLVLMLAALVQLWAAARLSSGLARTSAALATAGLVFFAAGSTIPIVISDAVPGSRYLPYLAIALLITAFVLGVVAWRGGMRAGFVVALSLAAVVAFVANQLFIVNLFNSVAVVVALGLLLRLRTGRQSAAPARGVRPRVIVVVGTVLLLGFIAFGVFDTLVLTPLWVTSGRPLEEIYAVVGDSAGIGGIVIWAVVAAVLALGYLVVGLVLARRPRAGDSARAVLVGLAVFAVVVMFMSTSGQALWYDVLNAFPGTRFDAAPARGLIYVAGVAALLVTATGWIAPRRPVVVATA
ncbi:hypothetical protein BH11ACT5_BH11ACT5_06470 [soil metagenome]